LLIFSSLFRLESRFFLAQRPADTVLGQTCQGTTSVQAGEWYHVNTYINFLNFAQYEISSTASYGFTLPTNGRFTSTSGVFLSETADPVSEPATIVLFGTGLVGLLGSRIRRKKK
jgi:hypothetical protein